MEFPLLNEPLMQAAKEYEATTSEEQIVEEEIPQLNMDIAKDYMHARPGYKPPNSIQADDGMGGKVY